MCRASVCLLIFSLAMLIPNFGAAAADVSGTAEPADGSLAPPVPDEKPSRGGDSPAEDGWMLPGNMENSSEVKPSPPLDLWERLRLGFAMDELTDEEYNKDYYARRPHYIRRITERSKRYLFHIMEEVERRDMPAEIALLPIIESALNPIAHSRSHASGLWQLIPSTAKRY